MQEINWGNFKAKFNGKEQKSFEWLCTLLFCDEFNKKTGIFRYKNQTGIETEPVEVNGEWIGFQARFYETKLADNKNNLKDFIKKAKEKTPKLNKILFYTNQEFAESSKKGQKEPKQKSEIEKYAKSQSVEIEWRTGSYFESEHVCIKNKTIAQHFFSLDKSIIDFIDELTQHTDAVLESINSKIQFKGKEINIDRSLTLKNFKAALKTLPLVILSGEGGVGKTAVIKDFYNQVKEKTPFFLFRAAEFNISNVNEFFKNYGKFILSDFIQAHQNIEEKYFVIDSAEKLSDIEHPEVFLEFLSILLGKQWTVIFTTRHSYLDDLKFQFIEVHHLNFQLLNIENIGIEELTGLSKIYSFNLPDNERLLELLQNPFYLNEYLQNYENLDNTTNFYDFKNLLWGKQISKTAYRRNNTHLKREDCFLKIAQKRVNEGHFFVEIDDCDDEALQRLEADDVIKYDSNSGGYFITHDIYEEWALDKIISRVFSKSENYKYFFDSLGTSLPIRRAFRTWLSEKLFSNSDEVKLLIENTINDDNVESFWKDEILVSVLLSDYSEAFFQLFENTLLADSQKLLTRIVFLLRIACKEIDESLLHLLGLRKVHGISLKTLFTKPKGSGWNCTIDFIHKHKEKLGLEKMYVIIPLLDDWNNKNKKGITTKKASQIGIYYYEEFLKNGGYWYGSRNEKKEQLIRVILQGASEIKDELNVIFNTVIAEKQTSHKDKYYALVETILLSITDGFEVTKNLPDHVVRLADLFWFRPPQKLAIYEHRSIGVEQYFCLSEMHDFNYFPASAFQTPIFQLLRFTPQKAIDFIISFTNKTVGFYAKSEFKDEVEEIEVFIDEKKPIKQYISNQLWNMYRGTQVSTCLLESIHMALEKWLLEYSKTSPQEELENWCRYLIGNSRSASITAVVASIVLANPQKLFNIAAILFQTKELFFYDTARLSLDQTAKGLYSIGYGLNYDRGLYQDERIKTCDDPHRKFSLEHMAVNYQFFRSKEENDDEAERRQKVLWGIFDEHYGKLPKKDKETRSDKTWRLYLARMDRRKMHPEVEKKNGQVLIKFNPEIEPELRKYSEDSLQKGSDVMKYTALKLWSNYRFTKEEDKYKQYQQYENNPQLVITETKEIVEKLKSTKIEDFSLLNHSIPAFTCSVLVRDYFDKLNLEEREFCKEVIIEFASRPLHFEQYRYQISDGTEPSIISLPDLLRHFPENKEEITSLLLILLIKSWGEISTFAIRSILHNLWEINFVEAHSVFLGYLLLKPRYDDLRDKIRKENYQKHIYDFSEAEVLKRFETKYKKELARVISNSVTYDELVDLETLDLETLKTAFELLPLKTKNEDHKKFLNVIFPVFSKKLFIDDDRTDYTLKHRFLEKFAYFILTSTEKEIKFYLKPFIEDFSNSRDLADFFQEFISAEDKLNQYEEFWVVWNAFYEKIVEACKKPRSYYYRKEVIHNYLLAWSYWKEDAKEWHSLKEREKAFFNKVANDIGHCPAVLYSLSKVLNDIGSNYLEEGISWISNILQKHGKLLSEELEVNTIYYIENLVRKYILKSRQKVKTIAHVKKQVIIILNFLIERGSVTGYLLRESIL